MPYYSGQVLRIDQATGEASATYLTVTDDDNLFQSQEAGTVYDLCGLDMAAPPVIDTSILTGTLLDGSSYSYTVGHFTARGKDFYLLPADKAPEAVATVATSDSKGALTPFSYLSHGLTLDDTALIAGKALSIHFFDGTVLQQDVVTVAVNDDDSLVQFGGQDGSAGSETGAGAGLLLGGDIGSLPFNETEQIAIVKVRYQDATGNHSFEALRYTYAPGGFFTQSFYLPRTGSIDLPSDFTYRGETVLATSPDGLRYAAFGLSDALTLHRGGGQGNFLQGGFAPDKLLGFGGEDTLVGGLGADRLDGGDAADILHGGAQNDTMLGGAGNDALFGGNDRDRLYGGADDDLLTGNWGNDTLFGDDGDDKVAAGSDNDVAYGGAGNDTVTGFDGEDRLLDGTGMDQLSGGFGTDVFVLTHDGEMDRIVDFEDGLDHIDLGVAFARLTLTTVKQGQVQIDTGTDLLLVFDTAHNLTAASFTAADFV